MFSTLPGTVLANCSSLCMWGDMKSDMPSISSVHGHSNWAQSTRSTNMKNISLLAFRCTHDCSTYVWPTLQSLVSCALYSRWASANRSTMYFCSRVKLADKAWSKNKVNKWPLNEIAKWCCLNLTTLRGRGVYHCLIQVCLIIQPAIQLVFD